MQVKFNNEHQGRREKEKKRKKEKRERKKEKKEKKGDILLFVVIKLK